jgi:CRISPR/Cas system-associated exonuclease Cas4 (RecB family)
MVKDKFSAVWVSHSSIGDYLKCPRAYYLKNMYRDPKTNHKIMLMQPPLALGQAVHEVVESLSQLPTEERFKESLLTKYDRAWEKISGPMGGFGSADEEKKFKERGAGMIKRIMDNPGPLQNRAIKIRQDLPYFWLSEEDNIILCGKIDWLEYIEESDSVGIIDFKTGKFDEDPDSLQLPIYILLAKNCQTREVSRLSYWYLDRDDSPTPVELPDLAESQKKILDLAKKIQLARKLEHFKCPQNDGCRVCRPYESIISGNATFVGVGGYSQDIYVLKNSAS